MRERASTLDYHRLRVGKIDSIAVFRVNASTANTPRAFTVVVNSSTLSWASRRPLPFARPSRLIVRNRAVSPTYCLFLSFVHERFDNDVVEMSESCASPRRPRSAISSIVKSDPDPVRSSKIREHRRGVPAVRNNANLPRIEATRLLTRRIASPSRQYFSAISGRQLKITRIRCACQL